MSTRAPCVVPPHAGPPHAAEYVADARWLPHAYDPRRDTLTFALVTRETHRGVPFLHSDHLSAAELSPPIPLLSIPAEDARAAAGPAHFIFHSAFCCSTLLTRALDVPGVAMGLNEPNVLMHFAKVWSDARRPPGALAALQTSLDLLSRPLLPGEAQIIKPSNATHHLIPPLLHTCPNAKAIVLTSSLELFLTSVVRRGAEGRLNARQFLRGFFDTLPFDLTLTQDEALLLTDLQAASLAWLMQISYLHSLMQRFGDRIRVLDCNTLLAQPAEVLAAIAAFFGLDKTDWTDVAAGPVFGQHSKNLGQRFSAEAHQTQHEEARAIYGKELATAWAWAHAIATRSNTQFGLTETLL
jgi:hypothetical protein